MILVITSRYLELVSLRFSPAVFRRSFLDTLRDVNETLKPETSSRFLAFSLRRDRDLPRTPRDKTFDFRSKTEIETYTDRDAFRDHRLKVAHSIVVTIFHLLCNVHASVTCTISV